MTDIPLSSNFGGNPLQKKALPPRPVEAVSFSRMGDHTPGVNSDAHYCAAHHKIGKPLAIICDGITGSITKKQHLTGKWMAGHSISALSTTIDLNAVPTAGAIACILSKKSWLYEDTVRTFLLNSLTTESVAACVTKFLSDNKISLTDSPGGLCFASLGATQEKLDEFTRLYFVQNRLIEEHLELDAVLHSLLTDPHESPKKLFSSPRSKLAFYIADTLPALGGAFRSHYKGKLPLVGGTTLVGAVELEDLFLLFSAGDSQACIIGPQGIVQGSLTIPHNSEEGALTSCIGVIASRYDESIIAPSPLTTVSIPKSEIPEGSYLIMWSDGCYLGFVMDAFMQSLDLENLDPKTILMTMEAARLSFVGFVEGQVQDFSVDDHTGMVIRIK